MALGKPFAGVKSGQASGLGVDVTLSPAPVIIVGQFVTLGANIRSYREPMTRAIKNVVIPSINKNFESGGRPAWTELAAGTIANRARDGFSPGPILVRTGKMRRAATAFARWQLTRDTAVMGADFPSSAQYGPIHQIADSEDIFGGVGNTAFLPGRPFALIQEEDQPKIEEIFVVWIRERLAAHGFMPV